jgi:hypothetical protein
VSLVEALQKMLERGRPIGDVVCNIESATLAGLIEYGCLRYAGPDSIPSLPSRIKDTALGLALFDVPSELGLRSAGPRKTAVKNLDIRSVEFHLVPDVNDLDEDVEWQNYLQRFERSAISVGFSKVSAANLQSAFFEMAENTRLHSRTPVCALVGYEAINDLALFTVADVGIGVLTSLRSNPRYGHLQQDIEAIQLAMQAGVTCRQGENG